MNNTNPVLNNTNPVVADIFTKPSKNRKAQRMQEQLLREQQIVTKYGNSPLGKDLIARLRRRYVLFGQGSSKLPSAPRKMSMTLKTGISSNLPHIQHLRVSKNMRQVKRILGRLVNAKESERWLSAPNALLGGICPIDSIKQGKTNQVIELLARLEEGIHV